MITLADCDRLRLCVLAALRLKLTLYFCEFGANLKRQAAKTQRRKRRKQRSNRFRRG